MGPGGAKSIAGPGGQGFGKVDCPGGDPVPAIEANADPGQGDARAAAPQPRQQSSQLALTDQQVVGPFDPDGEAEGLQFPGQGRAALSQTPPRGELQGRPCWPRPRLWRSASTTRGADAPAWSRRSSSFSVLQQSRRRSIRQGWGRGSGLGSGSVPTALPPGALPGTLWERGRSPGPSPGSGPAPAPGRRSSCRRAAATAPFKAPSASGPCGGRQPRAQRWDGPGPAGPSLRRRRRSRCPG